MKLFLSILNSLKSLKSITFSFVTELYGISVTDSIVKKRFSGRYETILWYTKTKNNIPLHTFNLDAVRIASKYPGKNVLEVHQKGSFQATHQEKTLKMFGQIYQM